MSLTKSTAGDDFLRDYNIKPYKLQAAYTPAVGDLVKLSTTAADAVARCASTDLPFGIVISINSSNGTVSVAELDAGVTLILEYTSTRTATAARCSRAATGCSRTRAATASSWRWTRPRPPEPAPW
jgi:hypothetical protein